MAEWNRHASRESGLQVCTLVDGALGSDAKSAVIGTPGGWFLSPSGEPFQVTLERIKQKSTPRYPTEEAAKAALLILKK